MLLVMYQVSDVPLLKPVQGPSDEDLAAAEQRLVESRLRVARLMSFEPRGSD